MPEPRLPALRRFQAAIAPDEGVGRTVVLEIGIGPTSEFGYDSLGQHLAQLHAPLVKGVNVPNGALCENVVFVECYQAAQRPWRQALGENDTRGPVAFANPERCLERGGTLGR